MNLKDYNRKKPKKLDLDDQEFLGILNKVIKSCTENFNCYEYSKAKQEIEQFFWSDFCDNYLEIIKKLMYTGSKSKKLSAQYTLYKSFLTILKLIAPIMPFITEEIYQEYFAKLEKDKSIHISEWPKIGIEKSKGDWEKIKENLSKIRQYKSQNHLPLNFPIGTVIFPFEDYNVLKLYEERFIMASGAAVIGPGKEFKVGIPKAGTEHTN